MRHLAKETKEIIIESARIFINDEFNYLLSKPIDTNSQMKKTININQEGINGAYEIVIKYKPL